MSDSVVDLDEVQALLLRAAGPSVAHQVLTVGPGQGGEAAAVLQRLPCSFGIYSENANRCSIGFTYRGLEALGMPKAYLRVMHRKSPAFAQGAYARSQVLGDVGESAASRWRYCFRPDVAHIVVSLHGAPDWVMQEALCLFQRWVRLRGNACSPPFVGQRLGAPAGEKGEWVHFGMRDGITEVSCDQAYPRPSARVLHQHEPGALLLGTPNDVGVNHYALPRAPRRVRAFFKGSSFGVFRPMSQDVAEFERQIADWVRDLPRPPKQGGSAPAAPDAQQSYLKAKLLGRWPDGSAIRPGELASAGLPQDPKRWDLDLPNDPRGLGCPVGSHVRRMQSSPDDRGHVFPRPLQRRSLPFGDWFDPKNPDSSSQERGLLGHFFCASLEDQFEHLMGQWATRPRLDMGEDEETKDPLIGHLDGLEGAFTFPMQGKPDMALKGMMAWTQTLGMLYGWYPGKAALETLLSGDFVPKDEEGPWL